MSSNLESMSIGELVALYNTKAEKPVKNFRDKATAIKRCQELGLKAGGNGEKAKAKKAQAGKAGRPQIKMDFPFVGSEHKVRDGSLRHRFIELMAGDGATEAQLVRCMEKYYADQGTPVEQSTLVGKVRNTLRVLHSYNGYGIREADGRFFLRTR